MRILSRSVLTAGIILTFCLRGFGSEAQEKPESKDLCAYSYEYIDVMVYSMLVTSPIGTSADQFKSYLRECTMKAYSYSPGNRQKYLELINNLIERVKAVRLIHALAGKKTEAEALQPIVATLEDTRIILRNKLPIDRGWGRDFLANFYMGYESTSVSGLKDKGTARLGMLVYNQISRTPDKQLGEQESLKLAPGVHFFGNVMVSSAAEKAVADNEDQTVTETLSADMNLFLPIMLRRQTAGVLAIGPIGCVEVSKPTDADMFSKKYLAGLRFAHSPESYLDVMYGRTEGLLGKRWEIRGQLPVAEALGGNLFLGGSANFSADSKKEDVDSVKIYIMWQVMFSDIFSAN